MVNLQSLLLLIHILFQAARATSSNSSFYSIQAATNLSELVWTPCATADGGCGIMEFCVKDDTKYAFRLPGQKCHPGRGPVLRMVPGKKYQITLNNTGNPTIQRHGAGFHTHGLHVSPSGNSDNMTRYVNPGRCSTFTLAIPANHMGGTHWYYSSFHPNTQVQIHGGAFGMIIVPERSGFAPTTQVQTWLQNELLLVASKLEEQVTIGNFYNLYLGNGYEHAIFNMVADSWYRLRVVGMETGGRPGVIAFPTNCTVHSVAIDGVWGFQVPINTVVKHQYDIISRMDFAIKCAPGTHNVTFFGGKVAELVAKSNPQAISSGSPFVRGSTWTTSASTQRPTYLQDLRTWSGPVKNFTFYITDGYVNNISWNPSQPHLNLTLGDVVQWTLRSTGSAPFHIQTYPMQVVTRGGCGWHQEGHYYDVISAIDGDAGEAAAVHLQEPPAGNDCVVRFRLLDFGGRVMIRSEYMELSDWGSMAWVNVSGGPNPDLSNMEEARCSASGRCILDGSCSAVYECNSTVGRDNCGGPCEVTSPLCSGDQICDTIENRCVSKLRSSRFQRISNSQAALAASIMNPTLGGFPGGGASENAFSSPTTLTTLKWKKQGCPPGYDFCGDLEFCDLGDNVKFAYRLPGEPCRPAKCPVIRMQPGKKYHLGLYNMAIPGPYSTTNLHTHGIHVPGAGNSDDITREVEPGYILYYTWTIPADHLGGTFWYHSHVHYITERQVSGGAFGMLIIEDPDSFAPTLEFKQWLNSEVLLIASKVGDVFLGNGNYNEPLALRTYNWHRLRIVGVDPEAKPKDLIVADSNCDVHRMQHDGVWNTVLPANIIPKTVWTMSGASRVELAIRCHREGIYSIRWFGGVVAQLVVQNGFVTSASPFVDGKQWNTESRRPPYLQDLRNYQGPLVNHDFTIKHGYINDRHWDKYVSLADFQYNSIVQWTVRGSAGHAFHLHVWHMQIVTPGGCGYHEEGQWYDVVSRSDGGDCVVRVPLYDYYDRTVLHCHYLEHEDAGTMGWVNVTGPYGKYVPLEYAYLQPEPIPNYVPPISNSNYTSVSMSDIHGHGHHQPPNTEESKPFPLAIALAVAIPCAALLLVAAVGYWAYHRKASSFREMEFDTRDDLEGTFPRMQRYFNPSSPSAKDFLKESMTVMATCLPEEDMPEEEESRSSVPFPTPMTTPAHKTAPTKGQNTAP